MGVEQVPAPVDPGRERDRLAEVAGEPHHRQGAAVVLPVGGGGPRGRAGQLAVPPGNLRQRVEAVAACGAAQLEQEAAPARGVVLGGPADLVAGSRPGGRIEHVREVAVGGLARGPGEQRQPADLRAAVGGERVGPERARAGLGGEAGCRTGDDVHRAAQGSRAEGGSRGPSHDLDAADPGAGDGGEVDGSPRCAQRQAVDEHLHAVRGHPADGDRRELPGGAETLDVHPGRHGQELRHPLGLAGEPVGVDHSGRRGGRLGELAPGKADDELVQLDGLRCGLVRPRRGRRGEREREHEGAGAPCNGSPRVHAARSPSDPDHTCREPFAADPEGGFLTPGAAERIVPPATLHLPAARAAVVTSSRVASPRLQWRDRAGL